MHRALQLAKYCDMGCILLFCDTIMTITMRYEFTFRKISRGMNENYKLSKRLFGFRLKKLRAS